MKLLFIQQLMNLLSVMRMRSRLGECVLVIEGKKPSGTERRRHGILGGNFYRRTYGDLRKQGFSRKDAMKKVAKDRGVSKEKFINILFSKKVGTVFLIL